MNAISGIEYRNDSGRTPDHKIIDDVVRRTRDSISVARLLSGRKLQHTVLGNVLVYFRSRSSWVRPYLSVGTGVVHLTADPRTPGVAQGITPPGRFRSTMAALHVAVGIDLRVHRGWALRYSFAETSSPNPISRQLAPPGTRMLANFRNLFGIAKEF